MADPMTAPEAPPVRTSVRLAAWTIALAFALLVAELVARIVFPLAEVRNFDRALYSQQMASAPLLARPSLAHASFSVESAPDGAQSLHALNLYGFRDGEWSVARRSARRVLVVGDSMVEGFLVPEAQTIPRVLEGLMHADQEDVEVWNLGVGGSGLKEYAELLQDAVATFAPDEVVLVLYANDIVASAGFGFKPQTLKPRIEPQRRSAWAPRLWQVASAVSRGEAVPRRWHQAPFLFFPAVPEPANPWTSKGAEFERVVDPAIARAMRTGHFNPFNVGEVQGYENYLKHQVDIRAWLAFVQATLSAQGIGWTLTFIPQPSQVTDHYLPYKQKFCPPGVPSLIAPAYQQGTAVAAAQAAALGIPFLDTTAALREREAAGQRMYWNHDEHMTAGGYALVAEGIQRLRRQTVLARK